MKPVRQIITQKWVQNDLGHFDGYISNLVIEEIENTRDDILKENMLELVESHTLKILDVNLDDGNCFPVAALLAERKIPFLFCTGDNIDTHQFAAWPDVPVIAKPYGEEMMIRGLLQLLGKDLPACTD